jgi:hypothetical protein
LLGGPQPEFGRQSPHFSRAKQTWGHGVSVVGSAWFVG